MPGYVQSLSRCQDTTGAAARSHALQKVAAGLARLRREYAAGRLPQLEVAMRRDDLPRCREAADMLLDGARNIVFFGTGGSSLGAQALAQSALLISTCPATRPGQPQFLFFDNLETPWMENALKSIDPHKTRYLVVSKSGTTPEVLFQLVHTLDQLKHAGIGPEARRHVVVLTQPDPGHENPLRAIASLYDLMVVDHHAEIGGRYSVLSSVGSLPAMLFGMDPVKMRQGAAAVLAPLLQEDARVEDLPPAAGAATILALEEAQGLNSVVMMPYSSRLRLFAAWFQQLWAESLGKKGQGSQPVTAVGPVDQHSQLQLYLDGPNDKFFTIIQLNTRGKGLRMPKGYGHLPGMSMLAGRTIGDMTDCQQRATAEALAERGRPVRTIRLEKVDEHALGALFMHFMLETILVGWARGIDPFNQPAVELSKELTRQYMKEIPPQ